MDDRPLILTLRLDADSQDRFDGLRRAHFPPERNLLAAHVTLFHALPAAAVDTVRADIADVARCAPFDLPVVDVRSLGRGVAYELRSPALDALRADLAFRWGQHLTRQDAQGFRARVTVQNKVRPEAARTLLTRLRDEFVPWTARAEGLDLWRYAGGPWESDGGAAFLKA